MKQNRFLIPMLFFTVLILVACGQAPSATPAGSFVGTVADTDAYIAIVPQENNNIIAYVCDGQTISVWFRGERNENSLDLTATNGARLQASLETETATGNVTLVDGQVHSFTATLASGEAGLYRAEEAIDGNNFVGGWILLNDGSQRGAVNGIKDGTSNTIAAPHFTAGSAVNVPDVGNFAPNLILPYIEQDNL
ncbi:MAG: hypothetical protein L0332_16670 [Chloroflexi bacterium]|nr:hypothetical protein [Chloroflexota bacterium]MCI0579138.1 hypothetical protein [Chloroflexota bacterium]MCI0643355.1 hypothetical protein [Chloroflexota bacterium]MCI0728334.1 hypothetical protein [Chloroflexota bacterium]